LTKGRYLPILEDVRRKAGSLVPLELSILEAGIELVVRGAPYFHGFLIAKEIKEREDARLLTAHGTLYKALDRMQKAGLLESEWEDPVLAAAEGRPRRRLYRVTVAGQAALAAARAPERSGAALKPETARATL
jgi:PadR family transcriptional regulator, regulatory protein PadR